MKMEQGKLYAVWYKHVKTGNMYEVLAHEAYLERDRTPVVVYRSAKDGTVWVRPDREFFDGRFVPCGSKLGDEIVPREVERSDGN